MFDGYLAQPYSVRPNDDPVLRYQRYLEGVYAAGYLMNKGLAIYSPIAHTHPIAMCCRLPTEFDFWARIDLKALDCCQDLYILSIPGWQQSKGLRLEVKHKDNTITGMDEVGPRVFYVIKQFPGEYVIRQASWTELKNDIVRSSCHMCFETYNKECPLCKGTGERNYD